MRTTTLESRRLLYLQTRAVIARHYRRELTLALIARALASSPRALQRALAQAGGTTFRELLAATRLKAGAQLLIEQPLPVASVARLVGYRQPAHFARAFRRRYGLAPAEFRRADRAARRGAHEAAESSHNPSEVKPTITASIQY